MSYKYELIYSNGEYLAVVTVTEDEADFIAATLEESQPGDDAAKEWRIIAGDLAEGNRRQFW